MNKRIGYSLLVSLGFYAGTTFGMVSRTATRGATALESAAGRYRLPPTIRPGGVPTTRTIMTMQPSSWSAGQTSATQPGLSGAERSKLFRSMHTQVQPSMGKSMTVSKGGWENFYKNYSEEEFVEEFFNKFKGLVSDIMLWVSGALALWAAKEFVDAKDQAAFVERQNIITRKSNQLTELWQKVNSIRNELYDQNASIEDRERFFAILKSAESEISGAYTNVSRNPDFNIENVMLVLLNTAIIQLEGIVNKYKAPQSYSDWAYDQARNVGSGITGLAKSLLESRQTRAQQREAIAGQPVPELPTRTPKGALTDEGQQLKLLERLKRSGLVVEDVD